MKDQEFFDFLDANGIAYAAGDRSIRFKVCPHCGNAKWKVYFFRDRENESKWFHGKCLRRDCKWNSFSYLEAFGCDEDEIRELHGRKPMERDAIVFDLFALPEPPPPRPPYKAQILSTKEWFHVEDWPDHPAAKYAVSRGYVPELHKYLMIDTISNAIVFLVHEDGKVVGWQKRFVSPTDPRYKTKNPDSVLFKKSQHVMEIPGESGICVVEGPATAFAAYHFGFHAICTFGAMISQKQLELIHKAAERTGKSVGVAFDMDFAGVCGYYRIRNYLERRGVTVYRIKPEEGNDLSDSWKAGKKCEVVEVEDDDTTVPPLVGELFEDLYE